MKILPMHHPLKFFSLISATLLLALASPVELRENYLKIAETPAQAQTSQGRKVEADRLLEQGIKQLNTQEVETALQSFQQALTIYQEIKDRSGEGQAFKNLGNAYYFSKDYTKAIESQQQALAVAKEIHDRDLEARALNNLGLAYKELGNSEKAIDYYQQALAIAKESHNRKLEQIVLNNLGFIHVGLRNPTKVVEYYQQVLVIARELQDRSAETAVLAYLGDAYSTLKDNQKAIEFAQQALVLARQIKNSGAEAIALDTLSRTYSSLGDANKTIEFAQPALVIARQLKNNFLEGRALAFLGDAYASLNDNQKAIEFAQQALAKARELQNPQIEVTALDALSRAYSSLKDSQKIIEFAQQGLVVARQIKNNLLEGRALLFLSIAYNSLENYQQAVELAQQSFTIAKEIKNPELQVSSLDTLGQAYSSLGEDVKALEFAQQGLAIAQEAKKPELECRSLFTLAAVHVREDAQKSIDSVQKCLAISQEFKIPQWELPGILFLSLLYLGLGDYQKSFEFNQQGLAIAQKIKNQKAEVFLQIIQPLNYLYQNEYKKALDSAQNLLAIAQANKSSDLEVWALSLMGAAYSDLGDYKKALELSEKGLAIVTKQQGRQRQSFPLGVIGDIYSKIGRKEEAISLYRQLLATDSSNLAGQVSLARAYRDLNLPITAITYYKEAANKVEKQRLLLRGITTELQESFLQKAVFGYVNRLERADIYRELADLLLSQGRILEAQQVLELLKVQELRDFTRNTRAGGEKPEVTFTQTEEQIKKENGTLIAFGQRLYECQQTQCSQLSQLLDQRQALTEQFNQKIETIEKEVRARRATDDGFFDPTKLAKAKEIVEAQPGTVLIYPLVLENKIWLLLTAKGGVIKSVEVTVGQTQLGETVLKFRQLLQNPRSDITEVKATSKQLYDWLIKPIEPELKGNQIQNLVFSLDRVTRYIPMSALFDGEKYLVENYAISTVISADLTDMRDRMPPGTQNTSVLALGLSNAVSDFDPLPNVPVELDAIVRKQPNDTKGIYPGKEFLNSSFDLRALRDNLLGNKLLHIATHGKFVPGRQEESYLLLGTGEKLTIPQIKTLQDLSDVHLVVLSACETALGEPDQDGVEISGISYYFLNSGAKAVMASLWLVNDESTSQLMQNFYTNIAKGTTQAPITKAEALRQAQLSMLHGNPSTIAALSDRGSLVAEAKPDSPTPSTSSAAAFSHPYYWAPFILIGNGL